MPLPHLTDAEILDMVAPLKQPAAIVRWFRAQGFTVREKPNGMPLVGRSHFEAMMAPPGTSVEPQDNDPSSTPDVAAFLLRHQKGVMYANGKTTNHQPARP